jgi:hypothetical protein
MIRQNEAFKDGNECAIAARLGEHLDNEFPPPESWKAAQPIVFCTDWQGKNADPQRETEVRLLWSCEYLFIRFRARYREIYVYPGGNSRRDQLWLRDVAEVFIRPPSEPLRHYYEFEISPNGDWLDLDISEGTKSSLMCKLKSRVVVDTQKYIWMAELAIPMDCFTPKFNPDKDWRLNFFRVEGTEPDRFYSAWRPTCTPRPNFHVPELFGVLHFSL